MESYQVNPNKSNRRYIVKITYEDSLTKVFHDKDTAIIHGIYSSSRTYEPQSIAWKKDDYTQIQMGSSDIIDGFSYALWKMKDKEKCSAIFYSPLGYSYSGSGSGIPSYSPLRFDIEIVDKE